MNLTNSSSSSDFSLASTEFSSAVKNPCDISSSDSSFNLICKPLPEVKDELEQVNGEEESVGKNHVEAQTGGSLEQVTSADSMAQPPSSYYYDHRPARRHWMLRDGKGFIYFPRHYPCYPVSTRYGRYMFQVHVGDAVPEDYYRRAVSNKVFKNLQVAKINRTQVKKCMLCSNLANVSWMDPTTRVHVIRGFKTLFSRQESLQVMCLENSKLSKVEGVVILCALSGGCRDTLRELHIWDMFSCGNNPLLMDKLSIVGQGRLIKPVETSLHYSEILSQFSALTKLSVNYAYIADTSGKLLLSLTCVRNGCLDELNVLCTEDGRPLKTCLGDGNGGNLIKDGVWRKLKMLCPKLSTRFVFVNLPNYENIMLFISKSIPMKNIFISSGIDFHTGMHISRAPWDFDSILQVFSHWYSETLEFLSINLWQQRDNLDIVLKQKILEEFPNLKVLEFVGVVHDCCMLHQLCDEVTTGSYSLTRLMIWIQVSKCNKNTLQNWKDKIQDCKNKYLKNFEELDIDFDIRLV